MGDSDITGVSNDGVVLITRTPTQNWTLDQAVVDAGVLIQRVRSRIDWPCLPRLYSFESV